MSVGHRKELNSEKLDSALNQSPHEFATLEGKPQFDTCSLEQTEKLYSTAHPGEKPEYKTNITDENNYAFSDTSASPNGQERNPRYNNYSLLNRSSDVQNESTNNEGYNMSSPTSTNAAPSTPMTTSRGPHQYNTFDCV